MIDFSSKLSCRHEFRCLLGWVFCISYNQYYQKYEEFYITQGSRDCTFLYCILSVKLHTSSYFLSGVVFLGGWTWCQQMCLTMDKGDHDHPMKSNSAVTFNKISTLGSSSIEESLVDVSRQSCKMSQICQIYLCKNIGKLG